MSNLHEVHRKLTRTWNRLNGGHKRLILGIIIIVFNFLLMRVLYNPSAPGEHHGLIVMAGVAIAFVGGPLVIIGLIVIIHLAVKRKEEEERQAKSDQLMRARAASSPTVIQQEREMRLEQAFSRLSELEGPPRINENGKPGENDTATTGDPFRQPLANAKLICSQLDYTKCDLSKLRITRTAADTINMWMKSPSGDMLVFKMRNDEVTGKVYISGNNIEYSSDEATDMRYTDMAKEFIKANPVMGFHPEELNQYIL